MCVLATQWAAVLKSSCTGPPWLLLQVFYGTRCSHVPHSTCSCPWVALHLFDQGTLVRRLATYCLCSIEYALVPCGDTSDQQHCSVSPVLLTTCGSPEVERHRFCFCLPLYSMWTLKEMRLLSACSLCSIKIKLLLSVRLQLEYSHVKLDYNTDINSVMACKCVHTGCPIIHENTTKSHKSEHIFHAFCFLIEALVYAIADFVSHALYITSCWVGSWLC